jgi:acyl-CoA synthetase (AMP-forming)/AMP-acid ligase II
MIVNETAIMDDEGNLLPPGQVGEIVHRGPNVMMGYYKDRGNGSRAEIRLASHRRSGADRRTR